MKRKRLLTFVFVLLTIGLAAGAVYIGYYLNQQGTAPEDADAGGGVGSCCHPQVGCVAGYKCQDNGCNSTARTDDPTLADEGPVFCGDIDGDKRNEYRCRGESTCYSEDPNLDCEAPASFTGICVQSPDTYPTQYPDCSAHYCEYPEVLVANRCGRSSSTPFCQCKVCDGKYSCSETSNDYYTGCSPSYTFATCQPAGCPTGYTDCGVSGALKGGTGCQRMTNISCTGYHPECHNMYVVYRYCALATTPYASNTPTVTTTATVTVTTTITGTITGTPSITNTTSPTATVTTTGSITGSPTNTTSPTLPITGSITITPPIITISVLPTMAIISDKADIVIGGTLLVIIGLTIFALGYNDRIGLFFYNIVGKKSFTSKRYFEEDIDRAISKGDKKKSKKAKK